MKKTPKKLPPFMKKVEDSPADKKTDAKIAKKKAFVPFKKVKK